MPAQTTKVSHIRYPDGAMVSVKASGESTYTDIGAISSSITNTLQYDENQLETANAGKLNKSLRNMTIAGGFTLINLNPDYISKMSGGLITKVETPGTEVTAFTNQSIVGFATGVAKNLLPVVTATGSAFKFASAPVLTSITGSTSGALAAGDDYFVIADQGSPSGYSVLFNAGGTATPGTTETYTVVFGANTPTASTTLYCGSSTITLDAYAMKITHTDGNGKIRELELFSVDTNSGGFVFNFKGANEDGVEEMPLTYTARIDTSKTNGQQLFSYKEETGAE